MASTLGPQLTQAISLATSPSSTNEQRHEAFIFLQSLKQNSLQCWQPCLEIFVDNKNDNWSYQERLFAIQLVGESLGQLDEQTIRFMQETIWNYLSNEFNPSSPSTNSQENGVTYIINSLSHFLTLLFLLLPPSTTPSLLSSLLTPPHSPSLLLRTFKEISEEISDVNLRLNKSSQRMALDSALRDRVREGGDAGRVMSWLWGVVQGGGGEEREGAVRCLGDWCSWVDINLTITPTTIPLIINVLSPSSDSSTGLRKATTELLVETVSKGMPPQDKLSLIQVLEIPSIVSLALSKQSSGSEEELESVAKLLAATGVQLVGVLDVATNPPTILTSALALLLPLHPLLLSLLSLPSKPLITSLTPYLISLLTLYKKEKKKKVKLANLVANGGSTNGVNGEGEEEEEKRVFLRELLERVLERVEYGGEWEWNAPNVVGEGGEDEEDVDWGEMRKNLTTVIDSIAFVDAELYSSTIQSMVLGVLDRYESGEAVGWQKVELAVWALYGFGQALSTPGPGAFVQVPPTEIALAKKDAAYRIDYASFPLSSLGAMLLRACRARLTDHPHPAVGLGMFEVVVRYWEFFRLCPECLGGVLEGFLGRSGLHRDDEQVQARVFYLFSRFVIQAKQTFQAQISAEVVANILTTIQDLLVVTAELPSDEPATIEQLTKTASQSSSFDAQLYLFEASGVLISILTSSPSQQVSLLRTLLTPLLSALQTPINLPPTTHEDLGKILLVHHLVMAVGNVAKGFPDLSAKSPVANGEWVGVFKEVTEQVLGVSKRYSEFVVVRTAARFFFNRIVVTTGTAILGLIPMLLDCLLGDVTLPELSELLSFLGLLVAKYKNEFLPILDTLLLPVFNQVFQFLKLPIAGTDDMIQHSNLRRAYFNFILSITSANLQEVLYSEKNKPQLQDILQSIPHYISHDALAPDQRFGFIVLNKFLGLWVTQYRPLTAPPVVANGTPPSPVPGFEKFLYSDVVKLCFEVPLKESFDYGDAQSYQVIGEICNLLKGLLQKRGPEFVQFMNGTLLPSIQCPQEAGQMFMNALQEAPDGKQFKKFASEWLRTSRGPPR